MLGFGTASTQAQHQVHSNCFVVYCKSVTITHECALAFFIFFNPILYITSSYMYIVLMGKRLCSKLVSAFGFPQKQYILPKGRDPRDGLQVFFCTGKSVLHGGLLTVYSSIRYLVHPPEPRSLSS